MKKILININLLLSFLLVGNLCANNNNNNNNRDNIVDEYTNMFKKIGKKRDGIEESKIDALTPPFVTIVRKKSSVEKIDVPNKSKMKTSSILKAIFNNQVKIDNEWYKLHDRVNGMEIVAIRDNYILLKNKKKSKKLKLGRDNANISIK